MGNLIHRGKGSFTHVENTIFFERELSAKAKGVYCQIRSLESNPEWVFTIAGFATLFKDGIDSIKSSLKELERFGFLIRARKRGADGRFVSSEESLWITLDDPSMYEEEAEELASQGFSIVSKRDDEKARKDKPEQRKKEKRQVETTCGFPTCGEPTSGSSIYGQTICGQSAAINPLVNPPLSGSTNPSLAPPSELEPARAARTGRASSFPDDFERLCAMSLKPIVAIGFKRDCYEAWKHRIDEGYTPEQIIAAYTSYSRSYEGRNGSDNSKAKNLASWLTREGGLVDFADDPDRCLALNEDGSPLSMEKLAEHHKRFGRLWRKASNRRRVVTSVLHADNVDFSEDELKQALEEDRQYRDFMNACRVAYDEYLLVVDPDNFYGLRREDSPFKGVDLMELVARQEEIRALANDDPTFAELLERYETLSRDTTACRLIGQLDDKAWERRRYEELRLQHEIESKIKKRCGKASLC